MSEDIIRVDAPAGFGYRLVAFVLDTVIIGIVLRLLQRTDVGPVVLPLAYFWIFTATLGRTPGKMVMGIELRTSRGRIGWKTAFLREVLGKTVAFGAFFLGVIWIAFDHQKRGWHDMIAGTYAVRAQEMAWSPGWEAAVSRLLAVETEVRPDQLDAVPESLRVAVLREFARRHSGEVSFEESVLRPIGAVEWF